MSRPRRAGKGVIRSDETLGSDPIDVASSPTITTTERALLRLPSPPPTLDIFSKFQQHRDDFDVNWVTMEETAAGSSAHPTAGPAIGLALKEKLRSTATALRVDRRTTSKEENEEEEEAIEVARVCSSVSGTTKMEGNDGMTDSSASSSACSAQGNPLKHSPVEAKGVEETEEEEEEYDPKGEDVIMKSGALSFSSSSAPPLSNALEDAAVEASMASILPPPQKKKKKKEAKLGLQGEFISFVSSPSPTAAISSEELIARMPAPREAKEIPREDDAARGMSTPRPRTKEEEEEMATAAFYGKFFTTRGTTSEMETETTSVCTPGGTMPSRPMPTKGTRCLRTTEAAEKGLAMPLWSLRRLRAVGGYCDAEAFPTIALHQEIMDLVHFLRPSDADIALRYYIAKEVERLAQTLWPDCHVIIYGSLRTKLLLPMSDVDLTLVNVPVASPAEALPLLAQVIDREKLNHRGYPQVIVKTKVPLIKFQHAGSLVDVDISLAAVDGKNNTEMVLEMLDVYPEATPLIVLIKYFLQQRDMDEPYRGGLGSYSTTLLVISFLQHHPIYTTRPEERPYTGLGKLLVDFFRYYGMYFNYNRCRVSVRNGGRYTLRSQDPVWGTSQGIRSPPPNGAGMSKQTGDGMLSTGLSSPNSPNTPGRTCQIEVEDPGNLENNASSSVRLFHAISSFFRYSYLALTANGIGVPCTPRYLERIRAQERRRTSSRSHRRRYERDERRSKEETSDWDELPSLEEISPEAKDIRLRPTLLSRILHVDPASLQRRRSVEATFHELWKSVPEKMKKIQVLMEEEEKTLQEKRRKWKEQRAPQEFTRRPRSQGDTSEDSFATFGEGTGRSRTDTPPNGQSPIATTPTRPTKISLLDRLRAATGGVEGIQGEPAVPSPLHQRTPEEEASILRLAGGGEKMTVRRQTTARDEEEENSMEQTTTRRADKTRKRARSSSPRETNSKSISSISSDSSSNSSNSSQSKKKKVKTQK